MPASLLSQIAGPILRIMLSSLRLLLVSRALGPPPKGLGPRRRFGGPDRLLALLMLMKVDSSGTRSSGGGEPDVEDEDGEAGSLGESIVPGVRMAG